MTVMAAIVTDEFADWEFAILAAAARGYSGIEVVTVTPDSGCVTSMGGLKVTPDMAVDAIDLARIDAIAVIGGTVWEQADAPDLTELLTIAHDNGKLIGAICGGTRALARSGLLDAVAHTSNDPAYLAGVANYRGQPHYVASPTALRSGRIVTASGLAPVSFMRTMITAMGAGSPELDHYAEMFGIEFERHDARRAA
jgi:putative intracellular protease/amidase